MHEHLWNPRMTFKKNKKKPVRSVSIVMYWMISKHTEKLAYREVRLSKTSKINGKYSPVL